MYLFSIICVMSTTFNITLSMLRERVSKQKSKKLSSYLCDCNQLHYQIDCMGKFVHIISNSSYWYQT